MSDSDGKEDEERTTPERGELPGIRLGRAGCVGLRPASAPAARDVAHSIIRIGLPEGGNSEPQEPGRVRPVPGHDLPVSGTYRADPCDQRLGDDARPPDRAA